MENTDVQEMLKAKLNAPPLPPLEAAAKFFRTYFADESFEEARAEIESMTAVNPRTILQGLTAIELLLSDPPDEPRTLAYLVAWEANKSLDDPSDEGAMIWLREVAEMIREVLGDKQPPVPESVVAEKSRRDLRV